MIFCASSGFRQILVDIDDGRDVACGRLRKAARHGLPMALHEREGDDAFENDDRRDDDEKGAGVEALWKHFADDAEKAGDVGVLAKAAIAGEDAVPGRMSCRGTTGIAVSTRDGSGGKPPMPLSIDIEDVALAPDRLQVDRVRRVGFDLAPQAIDLNVDCPLAAGVVVAR